MEESKNEFLQLACRLYMTALLAWMPLSTGGSYWKLGDRKYLIFRNVSLFCMGVWMVMALVLAVPRVRKRGLQGSRHALSTVDICMLLYGACVVLSTLCSSFGRTALMGYQDWYMGALSQILFVAGYFFVSRYCTVAALPVYLGEMAFLAVIVLGLLNRLGFDPLGLYEGFLTSDWEYSHMISTIGNINWFCGYCSVLLALPMAGYLYSRRRGKTLFMYGCSMLGLTLLCMQGSAIGPVIAVTGIGICLLAGIRKPEYFQKGLLLALGVCLLFPIMGRLISLKSAQAATPIDGDVYSIMLWNGWWILAAFWGVICLLHGRLRGRAQKNVAGTIIIIGVVTLLAILGYVLWKLSGTPVESWGSGRGTLWKMAWNAFASGDWKQKLLGAGPDCFAEYLTYRGVVPTIVTEGHWEGAVYANAHNEWLNHLVNMGLFGVMTYLAVFVCSLKRYKGMLLGLLACGMYLVNSLVSFQQVISTPLLFLVLGICESRYRAIVLF